MRTLVVGGSTGLGRAIAVEAARNGHPVVVHASEPEGAEATAADLRTRFGVAAGGVACDLGRPFDVEGVVTGTRRILGGNVQFLVLSAAVSDPRHDRWDADRTSLERIVEVNLVGQLRLLSAFSHDLKSGQGPAALALVSSVAAIRPRSENLAYASAKSALEFYVAGFRQGEPRSCRVQSYRVGRLSNGGEEASGWLPRGDPGAVARYIVGHTRRDVDGVVLPASWRPVAAAIRFAPSFVWDALWR